MAHRASETVKRVQLKALASGGQVRPGTRSVEWDVHGDCLAPVSVELKGRPEADARTRVITHTDPSRFMDMRVRCRRCDNCLRARARLWRYRALTEYRIACRTWLCTFTLRPDEGFRLLTETRVRLARASVSFEELDETRKFAEMDKTAYPTVQRWFKRVRKNTRAPIRYLFVTEAHKSGLPHWHCLVHEASELFPVRYVSLKDSWPLGFDSYKLLGDEKAAFYVTKYLSKSLAARVRASKRYGSGLI